MEQGFHTQLFSEHSEGFLSKQALFPSLGWGSQSASGWSRSQSTDAGPEMLRGYRRQQTTNYVCYLTFFSYCVSLVFSDHKPEMLFCS